MAHVEDSVPEEKVVVKGDVGVKDCGTSLDAPFDVGVRGYLRHCGHKICSLLEDETDTIGNKAKVIASGIACGDVVYRNGQGRKGTHEVRDCMVGALVGCIVEETKEDQSVNNGLTNCFWVIVA